MNATEQIALLRRACEMARDWTDNDVGMKAWLGKWRPEANKDITDYIADICRGALSATATPPDDAKPISAEDFAAVLMKVRSDRDECCADYQKEAARAVAAEQERDALQGIVDDIASETGHCLLLDDEEYEAPTLPDWVRGIVKERDRLRDWQESVADGLGYLNRAEGQGGYEVAKPEVIADTYNRICAERDAISKAHREVIDERDAAIAELEACKAKLAALASYRIDHRLDCEFDPPNAKSCTCGLDQLIASAKETP